MLITYPARQSHRRYCVKAFAVLFWTVRRVEMCCVETAKRGVNRWGHPTIFAVMIFPRPPSFVCDLVDPLELRPFPTTGDSQYYHVRAQTHARVDGGGERKRVRDRFPIIPAIKLRASRDTFAYSCACRMCRTRRI